MSGSRAIEVRPARAVRGRLRVPPDKSMSHRYALLAALAEGRTTIEAYSTGADCLSTLACLEGLGVGVQRAPAPGGGLTVTLTGRPDGFDPPAVPLDCGNSGTTMRLLAGVLAASPFTTTLVGDRSLSSRPMRRVMTPLASMGATLTAEGGRPPLTIQGGRLRGITFTPDVPSAQVKSAVLLAGLRAEGATTVREPALTRDHTERALTAFGVPTGRDGAGDITVHGGSRLTGGLTLRVPGDPSATAFLAVAAAGLPDSTIEIEDVGLNPTRTALFGALRRAGAQVTTIVEGERHGEPVGRVHITTGALRDLVITPAEVPLLIDELPALAALATFGGSIAVTGAEELRVKESDRITALLDGLRAMGADADEWPDGFHVRATRQLTGGVVDARHDHRLAMSFAIAALGATGPTSIAGAEVAAVSFPGFFEVLQGLRA